MPASAKFIGGRIRATETSPPQFVGGVKRRNLYAEQGRIGDEGLPIRYQSRVGCKISVATLEFREMAAKGARIRIDTEPGLFYLPA